MSSSPDLGDHLGDYEVDGLLGRGSFGAVYRVSSLRMPRTFALKWMRFGSDRSGERALERAEREVHALAAFHHPNIVGLVDVFTPGENELAIVMDFVEGKPLAAYMRDLEPVQFLFVFRQVASALARIHENGLIHRDVKPTNILVSWPYTSAEPHSVLIDFGIVGTPDDGAEGFLGSPAYASPEQAIGGMIGPASDCFSLGLIAYEVITKIAPFRSSSVEESLRRHAAWERPDLAAFCGFEFPDDFCGLVEQMLELDPAARPKNMTEVVSRTDAALGFSEVVAGSEMSEISAPGLEESCESEATVDVLERRGARLWVEGGYLRIRRGDSSNQELYPLGGEQPIAAIATDDGAVYSLSGGEVVITDGLTEVRVNVDHTVVRLIEQEGGFIEALTSRRDRFRLDFVGGVEPLPRRDMKVS